MNILTTLRSSFDHIKEHAYSRWERLSRRDQYASMLLAVFASILLIYFGLIAPLNHWQHKKQHTAISGYQDLYFVKENISGARVNEKKQQLNSNEIVSIVSQSGRQAGITFTRMQPVRNDGVSVWIDSVSFQRLLSWLLQLHNDNTLAIKQIRLERLAEEGTVKTFLRLSS